MEIVSTDDLRKLSKKDCVRFALFCAKQVTHLDDGIESKKCIEVIELWLLGKATSEECRVAAYAADAAADAAYAAANAAYAAANATYAANAANANAYAAYAAAYAAATAYAAHAAHAAADANAAYAAAYATAYANAKEKIIEAQREYYNDLLNFDSIFEEVYL